MALDVGMDGNVCRADRIYVCEFPFPVWMGWAGIFFLAGAVFAGLTIYLYHEDL